MAYTLTSKETSDLVRALGMFAPKLREAVKAGYGQGDLLTRLYVLHARLTAAADDGTDPVEFYDSEDGRAYIASGESRETSPEIMEALARLSRDAAEAEKLFDGDGFGEIASLADVAEIATANGRAKIADLYWGGQALSHIITTALQA